jgi:hypothetical protein
MTTLASLALAHCCTVVRVSNIFLKFRLVYGVLGAALWRYRPIIIPRKLKLGPHYTACKIPTLKLRQFTSRLGSLQSPSVSLIRTWNVDISIGAQSLAYRIQFHSLFATSTCLHAALTFQLCVIAGHLISLFKSYFGHRHPSLFTKTTKFYTISVFQVYRM